MGRRPLRSPRGRDGLSPPTSLRVPGPGRVVRGGGFPNRGGLSDPGCPTGGYRFAGCLIEGVDSGT
nr:MAG TPA: hypothetical protein [Caudoviricetes sp.]